ncbi:WD repeat-containing protein 25-like isoform X2 [Ornithodoros turicata]|uniref:WD repeat-containing protein 25-like isoform X2 n=1 Tax=Ornithodoros turicata TaxID=34597 RepID=UPI003138D359
MCSCTERHTVYVIDISDSRSSCRIHFCGRLMAALCLFVNKRQLNNVVEVMSDSESSAGENPDFFSLNVEDWNNELQERADQEYLELQHTMTIKENAHALTDAVMGPRRYEPGELPAKRTKRDHTEEELNFTRSMTVTAEHTRHCQEKPERKREENMLLDPAKLHQADLDSTNGYTGIPKRCYRKVQAHRKPVTSTAWSTKGYGDLLMTSSLDGSVKLWSELGKRCVYAGWAAAGVRCARFSRCGQKIFRCGFDRKLVLVDPTRDAAVYTANLKETPSCLCVDTTNESLVFVGYNGGVGLWDIRQEPRSAVLVYETHCGGVLDILLINDGKELVFSGDLVARDASHTALMVWDIASSALLSNQVYQERYTCPSLELLSPKNFVAQTNGNYIAIFSTARPYKMNKRKRFEGHKVAGYKVGCCVNSDASLLCSGDAEGLLHFYWADSCALAGVIQLDGNSPATHPVWQNGSHLAVGCWDGSLHLCQ